MVEYFHHENIEVKDNFADFTGNIGNYEELEEVVPGPVLLLFSGNMVPSGWLECMSPFQYHAGWIWLAVQQASGGLVHSYHWGDVNSAALL